MESDPTLPSTEDVIRKTEQITKNIQELLRAAQENKHDRSESAKRILIGLGSAVFHVLLQLMNKILLCLVACISCHFPCCSAILALQPPPILLHSAPLLSRCLLPPTPVSRPCEREGVRRLRHSLGCFSTLVPWAEKAPPSLQPLSLRAPDPTSWYSGLCPCLPGTVYFPLPHTAWDSSLLLLLLLSPANDLFGVQPNVFALNPDPI